MSKETYVIVSPKLVRKRMLIRRKSDGKVAWCRPRGILTPSLVDGEMVAASNAKELYLENLEWTTEG